MRKTKQATVRGSGRRQAGAGPQEWQKSYCWWRMMRVNHFLCPRVIVHSVFAGIVLLTIANEKGTISGTDLAIKAWVNWAYLLMRMCGREDLSGEPGQGIQPRVQIWQTAPQQAPLIFPVSSKPAWCMSPWQRSRQIELSKGLKSRLLQPGATHNPKPSFSELEMLQRNPPPLRSSVVRGAFQSDTEKKMVIQELWIRELKGTCVPSRYSRLSRGSKVLRKNWEDGIFAADLTHEGVLCGLHSCRLPEERGQAKGKQGQRRAAGSWDLCWHFFFK